MPQLTDFSGVWAVDFEYATDANGHPLPVCMVGKEYLSGDERRWWGDEFLHRRTSPIPSRPDHIFVSYAANAEMSCYLALGWPFPQTILDLYVEYRHTQNNGVRDGRKYGLLQALTHYHLGSLDAEEKHEMRALAQRYFPYTEAERQALLDYCASDVYGLCQLLPAMLPEIDLPQAFLRGRYMAAVARMERAGIPLDAALFTEVTEKWDALKAHLIADVDRQYQVFDRGHFSLIRWLAWCDTHGIDWPLTPKAHRPEIKTKTFRSMADTYAVVKPMAELRASLDQLDHTKLTMHADHRTRCWLNPFGTVTGRNAPPASEFILAGPAWLRRLIQAPPGYGVAYIDWSGQEIGAVAALSGDTAMMQAYQSGDPYVFFGRHIALIPPDGTADTHPQARAICKTLLLGTNYGMGARRFAEQAHLTVIQAQEYLRQHRLLFSRYWRWIEQEIEAAYAQGSMESPLGWRYQQVTPPRIKRGELTGVKRTTLQDYPAQATGGEIMRLALCFLTEQRFEVASAIHDAVLLVLPLETHVEDIARAQALMAKAGEIILHGFTLRTEVNWFPYPEHFHDPKGDRLWKIISDRLPKIGHGGVLTGVGT